MKKILVFYLAIFLGLLNQVYAQEEELPKTKSIYVELGGAGLPYSFNYDFRFDKSRLDSWGLRVGIGGYATNAASFFSAPIMANKLYGKGPHYFEMGFGLTFFAFEDKYDDFYCIDGYFDSDGFYVCDSFGDENYSFILDVNSSPNLMGTLNFGYRRIPTDGGFMWKVNLNPIFNNNGFWPLWVGLGFGYAF